MTVFIIGRVAVIDTISRPRPEAICGNIKQRSRCFSAHGKVVVNAIAIRIHLMHGHRCSNPLTAVIQRDIHTVGTIPAISVYRGIGITIAVCAIREEIVVKIAGKQDIAHEGRISEVNGRLHRVIRIRIRDSGDRNIITINASTGIIAGIIVAAEPTGGAFI